MSERDTHEKRVEGKVGERGKVKWCPISHPGAAVDRFQITGLTLFSKNVFSYVVDGVYDHTRFEVTISVSDGRHNTEAVAYIYVVPWTTTTPTTTTTTTVGLASR